MTPDGVVYVVDDDESVRRALVRLLRSVGLEAVQRALARSRDAHTEHAERGAIQHRLETLTPRERQVMGLVVRGMLNKQIAADLGAAEKTIKIHRGRVMKKMQADSVANLVRMAQRLGL